MKLEFKMAKKKKKRDGRGISAGRGKTAGRGTKGQKSRSGFRTKRGFEGGQNPLSQRIPKKRGFKPLKKVKSFIINTTALNKFQEGETVNAKKLKAKGLISGTGPLKVLAKGELTKKLKVEAHSFSKKAEEVIKKAGGEVIKIKK